eukprot:CAMPEP_0168523600 /NCGR_PEP_ID=MMETSP0405-20121227/10082_1 /TAXON_ID=498012 /ORGANISM="Trichosphaerium sp, Strain Am-I-7 wt" /LENGTH=118 /DNA_ID=CAMNT_0008545509 /DNA_START=170 /DNA_END=522 /DNA_ORIENTATION=-
MEKEKQQTQFNQVFDLVALPIELIVHILKQGTYTLRTAQTCHLLRDIVHNHVGYGRIRIKNTNEVQMLSGSPLLHNTTIDFFREKPTNDIIAALAGVHTISLYDCQSITDNGIVALAG